MKKRFLIPILFTTFFTGCDVIEDKHAKVVDSEVEGLEYQCSGLIEYTNKSGALSCAHTPVGFKIGEIRLGLIYKIPKDGIILPQDIVGVPRGNITDKNVIKLSMVLQTLDSDNNPENGITITKETREKLSNIPIDLKKMNINEIKELIQAQLGDVNFTKPKKSILHLNNSMRRFNIQESTNLNLNNFIFEE